MEAGERFPDVTVGTADGGTARTSDLLAGSAAVVYFYPKDATPGCTLEAHDFQAHLADFRAAGVSVFGVSADGQESHRSFAAECALGFPLLIDAEGALGSALGIFDPARARHARTTYLVGADGMVRRVWKAVQVKGHAAEVLAAARG